MCMVFWCVFCVGGWDDNFVLLVRVEEFFGFCVLVVFGVLFIGVLFFFVFCFLFFFVFLFLLLLLFGVLGEMNFLRSKNIQNLIDEFMLKNSLDKGHTLVGYDPANLDSLSPRRVRNMLVVSSLYDLYMLEEDGGLVEGLSLENSPLSQAVAPPRLIHATNVSDALEMIEDPSNSSNASSSASNASVDPFDLVICFLRVQENHHNLFDFIQRVNKAAPRLPVLLLATDMKQLKTLDPRVDESCRVNVQKTRAWESKKQGIWSWPFLWQGDFSLIHAMIKTVEDRLNMRHDAQIADVNAIVLVEDNVTYYSSFLPIIYKEIFTLTSNYLNEQHNLALKLRGLRSRLKILLATTHEEALEFFNSFPENIVGLVSDIGFPREGRHDELAGLHLAKYVREKYPNIPIVMQSALQANQERVEKELGNVTFINKSDPKLLTRVREFLMGPMGFGPFYFQSPQGKSIAKARGLRGFIDSFETVPMESILLHLKSQDFTRWLLTHGKYDLGKFMKDFNYTQFIKAHGEEALPSYLARVLRKLTDRQNVGIATMAHALQGGQSALDLPTFLSIGNGSLGGKGRSLGFFNSVLLRNGIPSLLDEFNVKVRIPRTLVITTSVFSDFLAEHDLLEKALTETQDEKVLEMFMQHDLPKNVLSFLSSFLDSIKGPLAVRSSSLFEDAYEKPFAGVYKTFLVPNNEDDLAPRLNQLQKYILFIYGSTYLQEAKKYAQGSGKRMEEERMAVLIQELVGCHDKGLFRPSFSGVMKSYDLYAKENENPKDGVCFVAPGFGGTVVDGGPALQFNPKNPEKVVSGKSLSAECLSLRLTSSKLSYSSSSSSFSFKTVSPPDLTGMNVTFEKVDIAKTVYPSLNDVYLKFFDNSNDQGMRGRKSEDCQEEEELIGMDVHGNLIDYSTFESSCDGELNDSQSNRKEIQKRKLIEVIQKSLFRLPSLFSLLLGVGQKAMANPVEIEFAVNLPQSATDPAELAILQIRPMNTIIAENILLNRDSLPPTDKSILWSAKSLGHGRFKNICDIVFVDPDLFDIDGTPLIAEQVGALTEPLNLSHRPYILIGPGRWGTASVKTGIPVTWSQIAGVSCLVETEIGDKSYEPSQGSHFFQNLTSFGVGLLSVNMQKDEGFVNYEYLKSLPPAAQKGCVRHVVIDPTELIMDSVSGCGVVLKPGHEYHSIVGQVSSFLELHGPMWA